MTAVKHIVHVTNSLGVNGGAEQQLVSNLQRFSDPGLRHTLVVLFGQDEGALRTADVPEAVDVRFVMDAASAHRVEIVKRLDEVVRSLHPDLIHSSVADASLASRLVGRRQRIPVVETLVNISHEAVRTVDNPNVVPWKLAAHRAVDRATMRSVAMFHALTPAVAESWQRTIGLPASKMRVIPRGVDLDAVVADVSRDEARRSVLGELGVDDDVFVVLNVGRQVAQKGQRYLLEAMSAVVPAHQDVVVLIAGQSGTNSEELSGLVSDLGQTAHILGARDDVPVLMAAADLFVFPSLFEGLGVSLLEAMANGLACITTDKAPMNGIVENNLTGVLVPERASAHIAGAIIELISDEARRTRLGEAARRHVVEHYPLDRAAASIEELYRDVLGVV